MRIALTCVALFLATPAAAQPAPAPQLPPEITDGRMIDQLGNVTEAMARAVMNMPVGELEAAIENRPVTREDRSKTVRSVSGMSDREISESVERGTAATKAGTQAMVRALPVITEALNRVGDELARAMANLPSPNYPRQ
jgi:hypothetical protein